jgi:hypothetical protein
VRLVLFPDLATLPAWSTSTSTSWVILNGSGFRPQFRKPPADTAKVFTMTLAAPEGAAVLRSGDGHLVWTFRGAGYKAPASEAWNLARVRDRGLSIAKVDLGWARFFGR